MSVSYVDSNRREDLRSAALFVIDGERQATGFDKHIRGSADVPDVVRIFDEVLATFSLESEIGDAIKSEEELPCWRTVLDSMEPVWLLWPTYSAFPDRLLVTPEWAAVRAAVEQCVARHGLWLEEIEFPATVEAEEQVLRVGSWRELEQVDPVLLSAARITDEHGRKIELDVAEAVTVRRVGLPRRDSA